MQTSLESDPLSIEIDPLTQEADPSWMQTTSTLEADSPHPGGRPHPTFCRPLSLNADLHGCRPH